MKRLVLTGHGGSGKDHLRSALQRQGLRVDVSVTTRPPRLDEIDGESYKFITRDEFDELVDKDQLYEHVLFNGHGYGSLRTSWEKAHVFIMTPEGIHAMSRHDRRETTVVFLNISEDVRRERLMLRWDEQDKVDRRITADNAAFEGFNDFDTMITDPSFNANTILSVGGCPLMA
jgi:guanylate kinase